jgi:sensor histidine kinase YesM
MSQNIYTISSTTTDQYVRDVAAALGFVITSQSGYYWYCYHTKYPYFNMRFYFYSTSSDCYLQMSVDGTTWRSVTNNFGGKQSASNPNGTTIFEKIEFGDEVFIAVLNDVYAVLGSNYQFAFATTYSFETGGKLDEILISNMGSSSGTATQWIETSPYSTITENSSRIYPIVVGECLMGNVVINDAYIKTWYGAKAKDTLLTNIPTNAKFKLVLDDGTKYRKYATDIFMRVE